jgi:hypothetical protein
MTSTREMRADDAATLLLSNDHGTTRRDAARTVGSSAPCISVNAKRTATKTDRGEHQTYSLLGSNGNADGMGSCSVRPVHGGKTNDAPSLLHSGHAPKTLQKEIPMTGLTNHSAGYMILPHDTHHLLRLTPGHRPVE